MRKILIVMMTAAVGCGGGGEGASATAGAAGDEVKTCDAIADKYVEAFGDVENRGVIRAKFLNECVLGPEDETTAPRDAVAKRGFRATLLA